MKKRLIIGFNFILIFMLAVSVNFIYQLKKTDNSYSAMFGELVPITELSEELSADVARANAHTQSYVLGNEGGKDLSIQYREAIQAKVAQLKQAALLEIDPQLYANIETASQTVEDEMAGVIALTDAGNSDDAKSKLATQGTNAVGALDAATAQLKEATQTIIATNNASRTASTNNTIM